MVGITFFNYINPNCGLMNVYWCVVALNLYFLTICFNCFSCHVFVSISENGGMAPEIVDSENSIV